MGGFGLGGGDGGFAKDSLGTRKAVRVVLMGGELGGERTSERGGKIVVLGIRTVRISWLLYIRWMFQALGQCLVHMCARV